MHNLDLNFHLNRQTGALSKAIDRGTRCVSGRALKSASKSGLMVAVNHRLSDQLPSHNTHRLFLLQRHQFRAVSAGFQRRAHLHRSRSGQQHSGKRANQFPLFQIQFFSNDSETPCFLSIFLFATETHSIFLEIFLFLNSETIFFEFRNFIFRNLKHFILKFRNF